MALMLGQLYDALRAGNVPDKARAAAEEVANYEGEIAKLRIEIAEIKSDVRLLKWMMGFVLAFQVANFFLQFR
jgi:phage shock protein A